jgi:hypothetical protein
MVISIVVMENPTQGPAPMINGELAGGSKEAEHGAVYANHGDELGQQDMPQNANVSMLPQQVYVASGMPSHPEMAGIEEQFRSMAMVSTDQHRNLVTEGLDDEYDLEGDNDEETSDEEPLKLFVGQVRLAFSVSSMFVSFACVSVGDTRIFHPGSANAGFLPISNINSSHPARPDFSHPTLNVRFLFNRYLKCLMKRTSSQSLSPLGRSRSLPSSVTSTLVCIVDVPLLPIGHTPMVKTHKQLCMISIHFLVAGDLPKLNRQSRQARVSHMF